MLFILWLKRHLWSGLRLPRCNRLTFLVSQSMDRKLTFNERLLLGAHYIICDRCDRYHKQLEVMRTSVQVDQGATAPDEGSLSPAARDRMKKLLSDYSS